MKNAVKRFIEAEDSMIKVAVNYATEEGSMMNLDGDQYRLFAGMMDVLRASNNVLIKEAETIESMRDRMIEMKNQLDNMIKKQNEMKQQLDDAAKKQK